MKTITETVIIGCTMFESIDDDAYGAVNRAQQLFVDQNGEIV